MPFEIAAATDVGRQRSGNEDAWDVIPLPDGAVCVVADGMGGHQAGEVASRLAVETIHDALLGDNRPQQDALVEAIQAANRAVFEASVADAARRGMGTTIVCALLHSGSARLANVGDSPAFLVRGGRVERLTEDHSWVAEEVARGALRPDEATLHPYRHVLTRCLGTDEEVEVQTYQPAELAPGEVLILCSDGLTEHVRDEELGTAVDELPSEAAARELIHLANKRGGSDNITVIVARRV